MEKFQLLSDCKFVGKENQASNHKNVTYVCRDRVIIITALLALVSMTNCLRSPANNDARNVSFPGVALAEAAS